MADSPANPPPLETKVTDISCPQCRGGEMIQTPADGCIFCAYCGHVHLPSLADRLDRAERAIAELQRTAREFWGFAPSADLDLMDLQ